MNRKDKQHPFIEDATGTKIVYDEAMCAAASGPSTIKAIPVDPGPPDTCLCLTACAANTSSLNASAVQERSPLHAQVRAIITSTGCNEYTAAVLFNSWMKLHGFLEQRGTLPDRFDEIDTHELAEFGLYCWSSRTSLTDEADALLVALPMLRILLVNAGYHRTALNALIKDANV
jgi:hypothetical protein